HPPARGTGSLMRIIVSSAATVTAALFSMPTAFAQDSAPVTRSVFVRRPDVFPSCEAICRDSRFFRKIRLYRNSL
ncbi:hypothetical protein, partial [Burkholderia anthina]|uniref:hypothetical protein n=1 Tax=Burkholderia anthina TaxID=179879 RepID=UPI001EEFE5CD